MTLEILTPDKKLFSGKVRSIRLPGEKGAFMILLNHAPIISNLVKGNVVFTTHDYKEETIAIAGGVIEVKKNNIVVLADV